MENYTADKEKHSDNEAAHAYKEGGEALHKSCFEIVDKHGNEEAHSESAEEGGKERKESEGLVLRVKAEDSHNDLNAVGDRVQL